MKEAARQRLVYVVAGLGLLAAIYVQFGVKVKKADPSLSAPAAELQQEVPNPSVSAQPATGIGQPIILAGTGQSDLPEGWGPDPFAPRQQRSHRGTTRTTGIRVASGSQMNATTEPDWRLGGIIYLPTKPVAYVNDQPVHVGQTVDGALVTEITPRSVIMQFRGERKTLTLGKG